MVIFHGYVNEIWTHTTFHLPTASLAQMTPKKYPRYFERFTFHLIGQIFQHWLVVQCAHLEK